MIDIGLLAKTLAASIAPFVLISGTGLLLLSQTNRFGRPIDRIRQLCIEYQKVPPKEKSFIKEQIDYLYKRCRLLRLSIAFSLFSIVCAALVVFFLYVGLALQFETGYLITILFPSSMISLVLGMIFYFWDIAITLHSIRMQIDHSIH